MYKNQDLERAWGEAFANPGKAVDIGRIVVCDVCNEDFTDRPDSGGMLCASYAYCPACTSRHEPKIHADGEAHLIRARCPRGTSFADFVRALRGNNNVVAVRPLQSAACRYCKQPFSSANVHTEAGWAEVRISETCEDCYDKLFAELDDE